MGDKYLQRDQTCPTCRATGNRISGPMAITLDRKCLDCGCRWDPKLVKPDPRIAALEQERDRLVAHLSLGVAACTFTEAQRERLVETERRYVHEREGR